MTIAPRIEDRPAVQYVAARDRMHRDHLGTVVPRALAEVAAGLHELLLAPSGPPFVRYFVVDYNTGDVDVHIGFPIETRKALPPLENLRIGDLPAGRYAVVTHAGSYDTLVDTTRALLEWAKGAHINWANVEDDKVTRWVSRAEHYIVGPPEETNPVNWRTDIAILIR